MLNVFPCYPKKSQLTWDIKCIRSIQFHQVMWTLTDIWFNLCNNIMLSLVFFYSSWLDYLLLVCPFKTNVLHPSTVLVRPLKDCWLFVFSHWDLVVTLVDHGIQQKIQRDFFHPPSICHGGTSRYARSDREAGATFQGNIRVWGCNLTGLRFGVWEEFSRFSGNDEMIINCICECKCLIYIYILYIYSWVNYSEKELFLLHCFQVGRLMWITICCIMLQRCTY